MSAKANGAVIYNGPSALDGAPIVAIVTGLASGSGNRKTGAMLQTWILRADVEPHTAIKTGDDKAICGDCPHRQHNDGACYVLVHNAPLAVYRAWQRGSYLDTTRDWHATAGLTVGRKVRLGAYGDPAAVPTDVWEALTFHAAGWTGYTHQWRTCDPALQEFCMASVDSPDERDTAQNMDWRTFRVVPASLESGVIQEGELLCPASEEAGKLTTCDRCGLCAGTTTKSRKSIMIPAHGSLKRKAKVL